MDTTILLTQTYFCLFACCVPVKGYTRSTLCDLQRDAYIFIPNGLFEILTKDLNRMSVDQFILEMEDDSIREWLDFLVENEYGYYTEDEKEFFRLKSITTEDNEPSQITNSIIDFDPWSAHNVKMIFQELSYLQCEAIELRFFYPEKIERLKEILSLTSRTTFRCVELLVEYDTSYTVDEIKNLFKKFFRLRKLTLHSHSESKITELYGERMLIFTEERITSEHHCGVVSPYLMTSNIHIYIESQNYNSCLNRKISVDKFGNIKNCPSHQKVFGKIGEKSLVEISKLPEFRNIWNVSKDMVEVCRDCEFRHMCIDCRAYIKDSKNGFSQPLKCNYNPYEGVWD